MSSYVPEPALRLLRGQADRLLTDTCEILTPTRTDDAEGGWSETGTTSVQVACRVSPIAAGTERTFAERWAALADYVVTLPAGTAVHETDRLLWGGRTLHVVDVSTRTDEIVRRVVAREVT